MAWFPKFRWQFLLWLWSTFALISGCALPFALVAWLGHALPFWVIPVVSGVCVGLALVWRRPGGGGAMLGALVSAGGIGAAWAGLNGLDPDWEQLLHFGAVLCPAGAVPGAFVGASAGWRIGPIVKVGVVTGGVTGLSVSATYACILTVAEEFHPFAIFLFPPFVLANLLVGAVWGSIFGLFWCGCRAVVARGDRPRVDGDTRAAHARVAWRIMKRALLVAGVWMTVLALCFVACLGRYWHRMAPLRDLEAFGGHLHHASGYVRLDHHVGDANLRRAVELLDELSNIRTWAFLDLSGTQVTGAGFVHLKGISEREYQLVVSDGQTDNAGLANLHALGDNVVCLKVIGAVYDEDKERIRRALPNVASIVFEEPPDGYYVDQEAEK
jgi:hypothetical protein